MKAHCSYDHGLTALELRNHVFFNQLCQVACKIS